jgi:hypothetical protein
VRPAALALAVISLALPTAASAAVKSGTDRDGGMRLTLDGRVLTAKIVDRKAEGQLFGKRIDAICSPRSRPARRGLVIKRQRWPASASRMSFEFGRDISRRAKWCLIEHEASDIAFVSFIERERPMFVAKGRGASGDWWRLAGWRGPLAEPCALLRIRGWSTRPCFGEFSERPITLGVRQFSVCRRDDVFVFGVASRGTVSVRALTAAGDVFEANLYDRASESRVRGRYFVAALPRGTEISRVEALDAAGNWLRRRVRDGGGQICDS